MTVARFGSWASPISAGLIARTGYFGVDQAEPDGPTIYWTEARPQESGRTTIIRRTADGQIADVLGPSFDARTTVHEYGGRCFTVADGRLWFTHLGDNRIYLTAGDPPTPLSPALPQVRYADPVLDRRRGLLFCVREDHRGPGEPVNSLVRLSADRPSDPVQIAGGHDFYATPRISPDGQQLCWISWRHPNMPWDGTELHVSDINADGSLSPPRCIAGGPAESVLFPQWTADGALSYLSDRSGRWVLYCQLGGATDPIGPTDVDCGGIPRVLGPAPYDLSGTEAGWSAISDEGVQQLVRIAPGRGAFSVVPTPFTFFFSVRCCGPNALVVAAGPRHDLGVYRVSEEGAVEQLDQGTGAAVSAELISLPDPVSFTTDDGDVGHAFFYPPANPAHQAPAGDRPPLIVNAHGGPVAATFPVKTLDILFWTSRGFAVLDVNYRGSIGYGRSYRERLYGRWGAVDVDDCIAAAQHVLARGLADASRVVIRGASAGGYTVLCALAFRDFFHAGLSFCGVSDPERFTQPGGTHKFESHYLEHLLGPYPEQIEVYRQRSPLRAADNINAPLLLLQGVDDPVVPVEQARLIADSLRRRGVPVELAEFPGEGHGFRRAESLRRFYETELHFLRTRFDLPDSADLGTERAHVAPQPTVP